ncbi:hypothetical protein J7E87_33090 [Streptomyces sp. ISL-1]|nr:hypothetical protein [Streptomyces sp. ISL-1]
MPVELELGVRPAGSPGRAGQQMADRLEQALAVRSFVRPQADADMLADVGEPGVRDQSKFE